MGNDSDSALLAALLGALIGGGLALIGGVITTFLVDWLAARRSRRQASERRLERLSNLEAEMRELAAQPVSNLGELIHRPFETPVWDETKGDIGFVAEEIALSVTGAYASAKAYNTVMAGSIGTSQTVTSSFARPAIIAEMKKQASALHAETLRLRKEAGL